MISGKAAAISGKAAAISVQPQRSSKAAAISGSRSDPGKAAAISGAAGSQGSDPGKAVAISGKAAAAGKVGVEVLNQCEFQYVWPSCMRCCLESGFTLLDEPTEVGRGADFSQLVTDIAFLQWETRESTWYTVVFS
jgi:hypothetical protein